MFGQWLEDGDDRYDVTWEGVCELLDDAEIGQARSDLKDALASKGVHVDYPKKQ